MIIELAIIVAYLASHVDWVDLDYDFICNNYPVRWG